MSVDTIIAGAVQAQKGIPGVAAAYPNAPEALNAFPCFVTVPKKGTVDFPRKPNLRDTLHEIDMMLLVSRAGDLAGADQALKPWVDLVISTFDQHMTLGGVCLVAAISDYTYGHVDYAGATYLGVTFTLKAREVEQVVFHG